MIATTQQLTAMAKALNAAICQLRLPAARLA
jgi:hypothetical protein